MQKESFISIKNIIIGSGLLWISLYLFPSILAAIFEGDNVSLFSVADQQRHIMLLNSTIGIFSFAAGFLVALIIKKKTFLHGLIIGGVTWIASLLTLIPVRSFGFFSVSLWFLIVPLPVIVGTLFGMGVKKVKEKQSWLFILIGLIFIITNVFFMPWLAKKAIEISVEREMKRQELESAETQSYLPSLKRDSQPVTEKAIIKPAPLSYEERFLAAANEKCPANIYDKVEHDNDSWFYYEDKALDTADECKYDRETKMLIKDK